MFCVYTHLTLNIYLKNYSVRIFTWMNIQLFPRISHLTPPPSLKNLYNTYIKAPSLRIFFYILRAELLKLAANDWYCFAFRSILFQSYGCFIISSERLQNLTGRRFYRVMYIPVMTQNLRLSSLFAETKDIKLP